MNSNKIIENRLAHLRHLSHSTAHRASFSDKVPHQEPKESELNELLNSFNSLKKSLRPKKNDFLREVLWQKKMIKYYLVTLILFLLNIYI